MVHARTSSGPAVKKYSSWSAAYPALMIFAKALKKKWIQFIQHIHTEQLNAPSNQFTRKDTTYFEDTESTFKHSDNRSSLFLWTLFGRLTFLLQHHKDSIWIRLFVRIQKYGINLNHPYQAALLVSCNFQDSRSQERNCSTEIQYWNNLL